jgi:hypothetical protein
LNSRPKNADTGTGTGAIETGAELAGVVANDELGSGAEAFGFTELLRRPLRGRVSRNSDTFSVSSSDRERNMSVARPPTIEHCRGRSASRIAFATPAKTVCNLASTPAGTRPICAETSYI